MIMKSKKLLVYFLMIFISEISSAQITFQKAYGGIINEQGSSVKQTNDSGYIVTGQIQSFGSGGSDVYLIKTNVFGDTLWTKIFGGINDDYGTSVQQTNDGGYIIAGISNSFSSSINNRDIYLIKTDASGLALWTKSLGGNNIDNASSIQQTSDGGYIITGLIDSFTPFSSDVSLIKTNSNGDTLWTKIFGGNNPDGGYFVQQTSDGGYIIIGETKSFGAGNSDVYLIKTDTGGVLLWTKTFGGINHDGGYSGHQTNDGGYIIVGYTSSFGAGDYDVYLIRTNTIGDTLWTKTFGGVNYDLGNSVQQTNDGGFIIVGSTFSPGAGASVYLIKTDSNGDTIWIKTFGGGGDNLAYCVQQTNDGGYIIAGTANSFGAGNHDVYLIKTDDSGNTGCNQGNPQTIVTTPATQVTNPSTIMFSPISTITTLSSIVSSGGTVTTLCTTVGIQSAITNSKSGISISPNPFHNATTISINETISFSDLTFEIFNVEGKMMRQISISSQKTIIERNRLAAGVYFYQLTDDGNLKSVGKLIVQ
jgi:type IX secretion system substrate protein